MSSAPSNPAPRPDDPDARAAAPLVEARGLVVSLGGHEILHGVDVRVERAETVALLGGNGSGKTTLVRSLLGLLDADAGDRRLQGEPLAKFRRWHEVGYVPQRSQLQVANATVDEVVRSGRLAHRRPFLPASRADRAAVDRALERVSLAGRRHEQLVHLSGGQQQRTLIARALASEPRLLVLDEPLAGLDLATQNSLATLLGQLQESGLGLLVVLHELGPLAGLIDRSVVLQDGRVIHDGPLLDGPGTADHHHRDHPSHATVVTNPTWHLHEEH